MGVDRPVGTFGRQRRTVSCTGKPSSTNPSITVPAGFVEEGLPVGVELLGRAWSEARLIELAYAYEQATHHRRSPESTPSLIENR